MSVSLPSYALPVAVGVVVLAAVVLTVRGALARQAAAPAPVPLSTEEHTLKLAQEKARADQIRALWRRRLVVWTLVTSFVLSFVIAVGAGWLSFGNQRQYALGANGGLTDEATVFALLLDAGALAFSLMRLFEAITGRSSNLTRAGLAAFIAASTTMNLLHAHHEKGQAPTAGAILYVIIPPLVYAALLEMLLWKTEQLVLGKYGKRKANTVRGYSLLMWLPWPIGFPVRLWKEWRADLQATIPNVRAPMSTKPLPAGAEPTADKRTSAQDETAPGTDSGAPEAEPTVPVEDVTAPAAHLGAVEGAPVLPAQSEPQAQEVCGAPVDLIKSVRRAVPIAAAQFEGAPQETGGALEPVELVRTGAEPEPAPVAAQAEPAAAHPAEVAAQTGPAQAQSAAQALPVTFREPEPVVETGPESLLAAVPVMAGTAPALSREARSPQVAARIETPVADAGLSKKDVLRDALLNGIRDGDQRIFSSDPKISNSVAYGLNKTLFTDPLIPVNESTVRRYVKELMPELLAARASMAEKPAEQAPEEPSATVRHLEGLAPVDPVEESELVGALEAQSAQEGAPQQAHSGAVGGEPVVLAQSEGSAQGEPGAVDQPLVEVRRAEPLLSAQFEGAPQETGGALETEPQASEAVSEEGAAQGGAVATAPLLSAQFEGAPQETGGALETEPQELAAHSGESPERAEGTGGEDEEELVLSLVGQRAASEPVDEVGFAHSL